MKSDDTAGRVKAYESIVKGENIPDPEVPESFKVLLKEMKSLCLNIELEGPGEKVVDVTNDRDEDEETRSDDSGIIGMLQEDAAKTEQEEEDALNSITAELDDLLSGVDLDLADTAASTDDEGEEQ